MLGTTETEKLSGHDFKGPLFIVRIHQGYNYITYCNQILCMYYTVQSSISMNQTAIGQCSTAIMLLGNDKGKYNFDLIMFGEENYFG